MKKLFRYLRRKPKHIRDQYALLFSGIFVLLVVSLWLPAEWRDSKAEQVAEVTEKKDLPFATLFKSMKDQVAAAIDSVSGEVEVEETAKEEESNSLHQGPTGEFILSETEVAELKQKLEATRKEPVVPEAGTYEEVLIATTSASTSLETEAD